MKRFNSLTVNQKINVKGNLTSLSKDITNIRNTVWDMPELTDCLINKPKQVISFDHARYVSE